MTMTKVNEIFKEIHDKHGNRYSDDQKRAWAHLIEMGKHESVIQPPKKRFFQSPPTTESISALQGSPSHPSTSKSPTTSPIRRATTLVSSPGRRVSIRSECIDQLQKWHSLLDCGAITKELYEELQGTILSDIRKL